MTGNKFITWFVILASAAITVAQPTPPRTVTAPVTVVAPKAPEPLTPAEQDAPLRVVQEGPVKVVQSGPVTLKIPLSMLIGWMVTIATGLTAIAVIWRYGTKAAELLLKIKALLSSFERNGTVLDAIAKEFKSDSGSTLKDAINRIEAATLVAQASASTAQGMAERLEKVMADHIKSVDAEKPK